MSTSDRNDYRHREHDHLVEPMWSGLGLERDGPERPALAGGEAPERGTSEPAGGLRARVARLLRALIGRGRR